jgi:hypothetical protein
MLADGPLPDRPHVDLQARDVLGEQLGVRQVNYPLMEAEIERGVIADRRERGRLGRLRLAGHCGRRLLAVAELREANEQIRDLLVGRALPRD